MSVAAVVLFAAAAGTDLRESARRVAEAWRGAGASVVVDRTRFLNDGNDERRPVALVLPQLPPGECTTVGLVGARGLGFRARLAKSGEDEPSKRVSSVAGALSIERCAEEPPRRLVLTSDSGRGAIEVVVARSARPLPALRSILPERTGASIVASPEPGILSPLPPPERRAETAETRAKRDGASVATRTTWKAGVEGSGAGEETLAPGCHVLQLFALDPRASQPTRRGRLDLDAEMRDEADDRPIARDRTDAPDALLSTCVGEQKHVEVVFAGAPPGSAVLVAHYAWPLPEHLPDVWSPEARSRAAHVLLSRHVALLPRDAAFLARGGGVGTTHIPVPIEPGACYLALATVTQGAARVIGLRVHVAARDASDDRGIDGQGAAVAFCAGPHEHAAIDVETHGQPLLGWGLAVYRIQSGIWDAR